MVTHCNILAWEIPWIEEPGGPQALGWQRVRHNLATNTHIDFVTPPPLPGATPTPPLHTFKLQEGGAGSFFFLLCIPSALHRSGTQYAKQTFTE